MLKIRGFTLVELLVSISIFAMVTALVLTKYQSFNGGIVLTNLAYEVALTVRQAQTYGIDVQGSANGFDVSYGVHFDDSINTSFGLFSDIHNGNCDLDTLVCAGNGHYDGTTEDVSTFALKRGIVINKFCVGTSLSNIANQDSSGLEQCASSGSGSKLDITFDRPDPSAVIDYFNGQSWLNPLGYARIQVMALGNNAIKDVIIQKSGQISIEDGK